MTLRQDESQWLIYQEDSVVPAVRALEVLAMLVAGPVLANHPEFSMRALGNMMIRLGAHRETYMLGKGEGNPTDPEVVAGRHLAVILGEMAGIANAEIPRDELHAAMYWLDSTLKQAGINTETWLAQVALGKR